MTAPMLPEPICILADRQGSAVMTRCGEIRELPPGRDLRSVNVGGINTATCPKCVHPSSYPDRPYDQDAS